MKRFEQTIMIVSFLAFSWLAMQAVHELGHVAGAWLTNGKVTKVALHPFILSRTELVHNPHPSVVVWSGPLVGVLLPLFVLMLARFFRSPGIYLFRFFAGFCLIANGVYIAFGSSTGAADTGIMIQHGSSRWLVLLFGILTVPPGLYLWHNQGRHFGLGKAGGQVSRSAAIVSVALLVLLAGVELIVNSR